MHIRKLRLLTPGPTPLYPPAVRAMAGADIHHRTEEFRQLYKQVLGDLQYFMGTSNDVMVFTSSGTGAMESAVSNLFSPGDKVLVATAGKFGERWVELTRAFGLQTTVLEAPYGGAVEPGRIAEALRAEPATQGVFLQTTESSTGASHDVEAIAQAVGGTDAVLVVDAITGLGTSHLDIDGWGLDVVIGGSQKAAMIPRGWLFFQSVPRPGSGPSPARRRTSTSTCSSTRRRATRASHRGRPRLRCCWAWPKRCATSARSAAKT